jgi:hypothetical protein
VPRLVDVRVGDRAQPPGCDARMSLTGGGVKVIKFEGARRPGLGTGTDHVCPDRADRGQPAEPRSRPVGDGRPAVVVAVWLFGRTTSPAIRGLCGHIDEWASVRRNDRMPGAGMESSRGLARSAIAALVVFAIVDVFDAIMAIGRYEFRITVVTHGEPSLSPAYTVYELVDNSVDDLCGSQHWSCDFGPSTAMWFLTLVWVLSALAVLATVSMWWFRERGRVRIPPRDGRRLMAAGVLFVVARLHQALASPPNPILEGALNRRTVAYPLWTVAAVVLVVVVRHLVRTIRQPAPDFSDSRR